MTLIFKGDGSDAELDFELLVDRYYEILYRFAFSLVHSESEAYDLTQQTFCIWIEKGHQLRDPAKVKTWLFTTLNREFLKTKRNMFKLHLEVELKTSEQDFYTSVMMLDLDSKKVLEALQNISESYRVPIVLFYMREHSYNEISEILELPIGTVKSRISRGKDLLYHHLNGTHCTFDNGSNRAGAEK
ncbi:MAG: RNA polymerase sigma factor [Photobacterium frigidiphilum]|uniref:RNA polymerase sigma factor n=1 Tax=Photobacterium frigidiphilum TaxID=264736 RepID=UPI00300256A5